MATERQKLTKCEKLILELISSTDGCDYSFSEMSQSLGISRQAVYLCLNSLAEDKYIEKSYFFVGRVKRCKYSVVDFFGKMDSKNFTSQKEEGGKNFTGKENEGGKNFTSQSKLEESGNKGISQRRVEVLGHKKRPATKLTKSLNNDYI